MLDIGFGDCIIFVLGTRLNDLISNNKMYKKYGNPTSLVTMTEVLWMKMINFRSTAFVEIYQEANENQDVLEGAAERS